jgi:hypothetical protein
MRNPHPGKTYSNVPRENPPTVPGSVPGVQRRREYEDEDEADAFDAWLRDVEAGRIG